MLKSRSVIEPVVRSLELWRIPEFQKREYPGGWTWQNVETHFRELLGIELSKQQPSSDWGAVELSAEQLAYAASDVLHLHALWARLEALLIRENRMALAEACFAFLPARGTLDLLGYEEPDILAH